MRNRNFLANHFTLFDAYYGNSPSLLHLLYLLTMSAHTECAYKSLDCHFFWLLGLESRLLFSCYEQNLTEQGDIAPYSLLGSPRIPQDPPETIKLGVHYSPSIWADPPPSDDLYFT